MAKRTIVWTDTAAKQRRQILKYWTERNQSTAFAEKLIEITAKHLKVISKNPEAFKETQFDSLRESAMGHFSLYYKITETQIIVMAFWDNRQDPKKLLKEISWFLFELHFVNEFTKALNQKCPPHSGRHFVRVTSSGFQILSYLFNPSCKPKLLRSSRIFCFIRRSK